MTSRSTASLLRALLVLSLLLCPAAAPAQESEDAVLTESRSLLADIADERAELRDLMKQQEGMEGEEAQLVERRRMRKALDILASVDELVKNILDLESRGIDAGEIRRPVEELVTTIGNVVRPRLEELNTSLADVNTRIQEAQGEDLVALEAERADLNQNINEIFRAAARNLKNMEALGLETAKASGFLANHLEERAAMETARIELLQDRIEVIQGRLAESPEDAGLKADLSSRQASRDAVIDNLQLAIRLMDEMGLDTAEYRQFLIDSTGEITTDILNTDVAISLVQQWAARVREWAAESGPGLIFKSFLVLLVLFVFFILSRIARRIMTRAVASPRVKVTQLVGKMIVTTTGNLVLFLGLLVALSQMGFSLGPVLAGLGIAGFVLGFALQEVLGNFAAGLMILIYRPFDVGDMIEAAGVFGKVHAMSMVSTSIMTIDNQTLIVPNGKIWGDVIKNVTGQSVRRVDMTFGISYGDDIPHTEKVLAGILEEHPKVLDDPEPMIRLHELGDSSVNFVVRPWVKTEDYWEVYWDVTREVKMRFDREGISIPFPQRDVHFYEEKRPSAGESGNQGGSKES